MQKSCLFSAETCGLLMGVLRHCAKHLLLHALQRQSALLLAPLHMINININFKEMSLRFAHPFYFTPKWL